MKKLMLVAVMAVCGGDTGGMCGAGGSASVGGQCTSGGCGGE